MNITKENCSASSSSDIENALKKKVSQGKQCVAYGCTNTFYDVTGNKTGIHFFKFPQTNPRKTIGVI